MVVAFCCAIHGETHLHDFTCLSFTFSMGLIGDSGIGDSSRGNNDGAAVSSIHWRKLDIAKSSKQHVDGLKAALMLLPVLDDSYTPGVPPASHHVADVKLDEVHNLVGLQINLDGVVGLDERVGVADGAAVVGVQSLNCTQTNRKAVSISQAYYERAWEFPAM
ncbi:hypothetical protein ZEAMMB73_Zm00001d030501 [Zea mays]|uniref:Uncharacterized protein n=1 Tax=Zea mays TaxID=4577 RepID=A0A1D6KCK4_MAIZE|nr:hypothetical protein ZEAMMB73_Zm00001d030501 [Zea mays]